jgi:hypothetical protein
MRFLVDGLGLGGSWRAVGLLPTVSRSKRWTAEARSVFEMK